MLGTCICSPTVLEGGKKSLASWCGQNNSNDCMFVQRFVIGVVGFVGEIMVNDIDLPQLKTLLT